jgi:hypothetical protein
MVRQGTPISRFYFAELLPTIATQRLVSRHTLAEQQTFDAIDVADTLGD